MNRAQTDSALDSYSISKRLSFDFNASNSPRRRRNSVQDDDADQDEMDPKRPRQDKDSNESFSAVVGMSPWESRRLKVDLIESRSRISQMARELENQNLIKANLEAMYQDKVNGLMKQVEYTTKKAGDLEKHLQLIRKRESQAKEDLTRATGALRTARQQNDDQVAELKRTNQNLEETLQCMTNDLRNEISNLNRDLQLALLNLTTTQDELEAVRGVNASLQERVNRLVDVEKELDEEKQKHQTAQLRLKDLQFQLDSHGEWQEVSKKTIGRLSGMGDLDKEVIRLRAESKNMREMIGNKLLLEEEVFDLRTRLERQEQQTVDAVKLTVQVEQLQSELNDWKSIAADHCPSAGSPNPITLRTRLEEILKTNLIMSSEKHTDNSKRNSISGEIQELRSQNEIYMKKITDLMTALKDKQTLLQRIQKKMMLVAAERDCFRQVIDHYEKEVTISGPASAASPHSQDQLRIDMLEKTVKGYKELVGNLEKDLLAAKGSSADGSVPIGTNSQQYERLRRDLDEVRLENERLRRRKEEIELKYEQLAIKVGGGGLAGSQERRDRLKVVHFQGNPADVAYESHKADVDKLRAEIERLRRTIRKMENDQEEMTSRFNETNNMTCNIREQSELRNQLQSLESKNQHIKDVFKRASLEFREVIYMLFGYRVDRIGSSNYRLSSMYAENEEEYLNFRLNDSSQLDLLETDYSASLADLLKPLASHHSLPVFLSSLTMELFNRATISIM